MKKLLKLAALAVLLAGFAGSAFGQATPSFTTTSAAVAGGDVYTSGGLSTPTPDFKISVASVTGAVAAVGGNISTWAYVDEELMGIISVDSTNKVLTVLRGQEGTQVKSHTTSSPVVIGGSVFFQKSDPSGGACTSTGVAQSIWITVQLGRWWLCDSASGNWLPVLSAGSITPAATAAAVGVSFQTFTLNGVTAGEPIWLAVQPAPTALCPTVSARASAANTVQLGFATLTVAACTPASGVYMFFAPLRY